MTIFKQRFYHITTDLTHNGYFYPRVPAYRHPDGEDATISRISVSDSIESCLGAIPGGGIDLEGTNSIQRGYYRVFEIDINKLGISPSAVKDYLYLYEKGLVPDAKATHEYWITEPFQVPEEDSYIIQLQCWEEGTVDIIPHSIWKAIEQPEECPFELYEQTYGEAAPSITRIYDAIIHTEKGYEHEEELYLPVEGEKERNALERYLDEQGFEIVNANDIEICIRVQPSQNLRELFLAHALFAGLIAKEKELCV